MRKSSGVELAADPEPAARVDRVHPDQRLVHAEQVGQQVAVPHRDLGHAEDSQLAAVRAGHGQQAARLQRHAAVPADGQLDPDHVRRGGEGRAGVAVAAGEFGRGARLVPVVEGPVVEGPVVEGPVVEGPVVEGPVVEGPVVEGGAGVEDGGLVGDVDPTSSAASSQA